MPFKQANFFKANFFLIVIFVILVSIISFQAFRRAARRIASDFFYPFLSTAADVEQTVKNKSLLLKSRRELAGNVEKLQGENDRLNTELAILRNLSKENRQLRYLLDLPNRRNFKYIPAELILRDPAHWFNTFTVNKGSSSGVMPGAAVLSTSYDPATGRTLPVVVGRIKSVTKHSAIVSTILNRETRMSVVLPKSRTAGILAGGERYGDKFLVKIKYLPRDTVYYNSEEVITSGFSPYTPPSLIVGKLAGTDGPDMKIADNLYNEAMMVPAANFDDINFVMIVIRKQEKSGMR